MIDFLLSLLFICLLGLLAFLPLKKTIQRKKQRRVLQTVQQLFADTDPFSLAKQAREHLAGRDDLIYGEMLLNTWLELLTQLSLQPNQVFYDLGSGCGKIAIATKLRYPTLTVKGIEILSDLHHLAKQKWQQHCRLNHLTSNSQIQFIAGDFLECAFQDADIIFLNATAFSDTTWQQILVKLKSLKSGTQIVITTKLLPEAYFAKKYQGMELMSWGYASTYIYEKI